MAKSSKKRSRTWMWVVGLLIATVVMAALHNGLLTGACFWAAVIVGMVSAFRSSPKPAPGSAEYNYAEPDYDADDQRRHSRWEDDRRREDEYFQDGFDAEQREHEDRGEV